MCFKRILFICGSLEKGRDGVGDYTFNLAAELLKQGHEIAIIALADKFVPELTTETINATHGRVLRIPYGFSNSDKRLHVLDIIKEFKPDWISIQFVIYNYHPKGLPFGLHKLLGSFSKNIRVHIMFHELWIGISDRSPVIHKIYGFFQKRIIASVINSVKPKVVSTSHVLYRYILEQINTRSVILPVFSNIPVAPQDKAYVASVLDKIGIKSDAELANWIIIGTFGKLHPDTKIEPILMQELNAAQTSGRKLAFISFGKVGSEGEKELSRLEKAFASTIRFINLGELSPEEISNTMNLLNKGISSTPLHFIGKSGVFAAMKLHNVDVFIPEEAMFPQLDAKIKAYTNNFIKQDPSQWDVANVAKKFLGLLQ